MTAKHRSKQADSTDVREGSLIVNADGSVVPSSSLVLDAPEGAEPTAGPEAATR